LKVLFAIKGLSTAGGAERVICDVTSYLADCRGHEISLLTFGREDQEPFYPVSRAVQQIPLGIGDTRSSTSLPILLRRIWALRRAVLSHAPDVVVAFMHSMFVPMAFALTGTGIPLIASEHIVREYYRSRRLQFALFAAAMPFMRCVTVLSDSIARGYPRWIHRKMTVVTNPISPAFQREPPFEGSTDSCRILSIGRFSKRKDHATLLAAFASLAEEFPQWSLRILGDGVLRPAIQAQAERLGLQGRVSLPGPVTDVAGELANASFFALASRYESFGLVFAEAMACGKASVAFADCQGANELVVDGETGVLVEGPDRIQAMASGLRRLMTDPVAREDMGKRARRRVSQRFAIERVGERWEQILQSATRNQTICVE
jgi:glycosyltransferase involved in cell wall biosynthesis